MAVLLSTGAGAVIGAATARDRRDRGPNAAIRAGVGLVGSLLTIAILDQGRPYAAIDVEMPVRADTPHHPR